MDLSALHLALLAALAVVAGGLNALAGGGTLITFPALMAAGLPAVSANVTNTVALVPGYAGGTLGQRADLARTRHDAIWLGIAGATGGLLGGAILLRLGDAAFERIVPFLILGSTGLLAAEPKLKAWATSRMRHGEDRDASRPVQAGAALVGGTYAGFFGAGFGIVMLSLLAPLRAGALAVVNALKQLISLSANGAAALLFATSGRVVWQAAAVMAVGAFLGGSAGGRLAHRVPQRPLRILMILLGTTIGLIYLVRMR